MKPLNLVFMMLFCQLMGYEVKMHVVDEIGAPVEGAAVEVLFVNYNGSDVKKGVTGPGGAYGTSGSGNDSVMLRASKEGYYSAQMERLSKDKDHDVRVTLPRIRKPVPLYAVREVSPKFPVQGEWVGFDFEAADWVAPYGKGKTMDILFRFRNEFKGWRDGVGEKLDELIARSKDLYKIRKEEWTMEEFKMWHGKWDGAMEVSFPNEGEGVFVLQQLLEYSQLKMPHEAPLDGYTSTMRFEVNGHSQTPTFGHVGFFLRTRVKRDGQGKLISANFAKVIGGFKFSATGGRVTFSYHFNPLSNDRNLEFAAGRNLLNVRMHDGFVYNIEP